MCYFHLITGVKCYIWKYPQLDDLLHILTFDFHQKQRGKHLKSTTALVIISDSQPSTLPRPPTAWNTFNSPDCVLLRWRSKSLQYHITKKTNASRTHFFFILSLQKYHRNQRLYRKEANLFLLPLVTGRLRRCSFIFAIGFFRVALENNIPAALTPLWREATQCY